MQLKKTVCICLCALFCLSFAACAKQGGGSTQTEDPEVDTAPVEIEETVDHAAAAKEKAEAVAACPESDLITAVRGGALTLVSYCGTATDVRIPDTVGGEALTAIAEGAFQDHTELKTLILPKGITSLGRGILKGCTDLAYLETPLLGAHGTSKQYLGYLFGSESHADNLRDIPASLSVLALCDGMTGLLDHALFECNNLKCVILPETLKTVGNFACYNCTSLEQIDGIDGVEEIGEYAFSNCTSLVTLAFGSDTRKIGFAALYGARSLQELTVPFAGGGEEGNGYLAYIFGAEYPDFATGFYPSKLARVVITEGCRTLGNYAFYECANLKEIVLPSTLESIGVRAFAGCDKIWRIDLPDSLTVIRENAFWGCDSLMKVSFGQNLSSVGINAFYHCDSLESVTLPQSLKALPASCFAGCTALKTVDLGGVTQVGAQAFRNCASLREVKTDKDVTFAAGNEAAEDLVR